MIPAALKDGTPVQQALECDQGRVKDWNGEDQTGHEHSHQDVRNVPVRTHQCESGQGEAEEPTPTVPHEDLGRWEVVQKKPECRASEQQWKMGKLNASRQQRKQKEKDRC